MPKIIVKVHHLKGSKPSAGLVQYIATREGVDTSVNQKLSQGRATKKQMEAINEMLEQYPEAVDSPEYREYITDPNRQTASSLITVIAENNSSFFENREEYLGYIATRPRVEKLGTHGLFSADSETDLAAAKAEIASHSGVIWTPIISLMREDAARLGYDTADSWRDLILAKQLELAEIFGIPGEDFKWYAAFHNEGHHPHLHMMVYSTGSKHGYLTEKNIEQMKSLLAHEIFKQDMYQLYDEKTSARERISDTVKDQIHELAEQIQGADISDSPLCGMLISLAEKLKTAKGKKLYGYLPKPLKKEVDSMVEAMAENPHLKLLYEKWCEIQKQIIGIYQDAEVDFPPLWENKEFKKIKNAVIAEAVRLGDDRISYTQTEDNGDVSEAMDAELLSRSEDDTGEDVLDEPQDTPPLDSLPAATHEHKGAEQEQRVSYSPNVVEAAASLLYRLARLMEDDARQKIDGHNKTIVDSKERREILKKKQRLGLRLE